MATPQFPEVQGGGSLILAWQIKNKRVLVVGGGEVRSKNLNYGDIITRRDPLTIMLRLPQVEY
jgi:hypothetical protein